VDRVPFFPDITSWYQAKRLGIGKPQLFLPGEYIPDSSEIHSYKSTLPSHLADFTLRDFYRKYDWGLPAHIYSWFEEKYNQNVEKQTIIETQLKTIVWKTPYGELKRTYRIDAEGNWAEYGHMIKHLSELKILKFILENTFYIPKYQNVEKFLRENPDNGVCDIVLFRSPFGKLIHEYMGFERVVYALHDEEKTIFDFLEFQEHQDRALLDLAAGAPARLVIISDHADENLISPPMYRKYCIPFYRKACKLFHEKGKYVSTHLDGNIKGYLPFITETGFDLLDGCTPAPMFNYEVCELAEATYNKIACYCGVPASFFTTKTSTREILNFGEMIINAFKGRVIVNVGDILPPMGDIEKVIALGEYIMAYLDFLEK